MGFWKKDPLDLEIIRTERLLDYAETDDERAQITDRLSVLYELKAKKNVNKLHITGDGLAKCLTIVGVAAVGAVAEAFGWIIPNWAKNKP